MPKNQFTIQQSLWEEHIEQTSAEHRIPSIAVGIVRCGELAWFHSCGETQLGNGKPPHEHSTFRVASNTKTFTAATLMIMQEASMLSLDDPLLLHIPEFTAANPSAGNLEDVTLKRLATHYSGLPTEHPATDWDAPRFPHMQEMIERIDEVETVIPPDSQWKYSNMAYGFLGEAIARLSGKTFQQFIRSELLEPLGMADTTFHPEDVSEANRVTGYSPPSPGQDELRAAPYANLNGLDSAGQLITTVSDLAKWLAFHMRDTQYPDKNSQILSAHSMRELMHPAYIDEQWSTGQCIGWRATRHSENVYLGHGGGIHGFGTQTIFHRPSQIGVVVLTNLWPNSATAQIATDILNMATNNATDQTQIQPAMPSIKPVENNPASPLSSYSGTYFAEPGFSIRIFAISDDAIHLDTLDETPYHLHTPAQANLVKNNKFKVQNGRAAGEIIGFAEDSSFTLGGFKYRKISNNNH